MLNITNLNKSVFEIFILLFSYCKMVDEIFRPVKEYLV